MIPLNFILQKVQTEPALQMAFSYAELEKFP